MKVKSESEVTQSCPTLSDPMDYSLPGSSVQGIFQVRVLEWGTIAFSIARDIYVCVCVCVCIPHYFKAPKTCPLLSYYSRYVGIITDLSSKWVSCSVVRMTVNRVALLSS